MTEASWGEMAPSNIEWRMSAALENVPRGDAELAEVTSLKGAVQAWLALDAGRRAAATLTTEYPILIDGVSLTELSADKIAQLAERLPGNDEARDPDAIDDAG